MAEIVPMRSVLVTDYGEFELAASVAAKIATYPKVKYRNPFADDDADEMDIVDFNHPILARYYRAVSNRMKAEWLAG